MFREVSGRGWHGGLGTARLCVGNLVEPSFFFFSEKETPQQSELWKSTSKSILFVFLSLCPLLLPHRTRGITPKESILFWRFVSRGGTEDAVSGSDQRASEVDGMLQMFN